MIFQFVILAILILVVAYFLRDFYLGAMTIIVSAIVIAIMTSASAHAQTAPTVADPAYANMQRAVGGVIQQTAVARGYSTTDPRTYSTLYSVGKVAVGAAAGAGVALLVGGTSPAWGTVLAVSAVGAGVSWLINLALDKSYSWAFKTSDPSAVTVTQNSSPAPSSYYDTICFSTGACGPDYSNINIPDFPYTNGDAYIINPDGNNGFYKISNHPKFQCSYPIPVNGSTPGPLASSYTSDPVKFCHTYNTRYIMLCNPSTYPNNCLVCAVNRNSQGKFLFTKASQPFDSSGCLNKWVPENLPYFRGYPLLAPDPLSTGPTTAQKTFADAVATAPASAKSQKVDYATMAMMVNKLWQQAAAQPGYQGIPYQVTAPITETEVKTWAEANPAAYPTVEALLAPVTDTATGFAPSTTTQTATAVDPATSTTSKTSTNPSTQAEVNLGPDPNITSPSLEVIPSATQILQPLISLFPDIKNYTVPGHSGECPKPVFNVFGKSLLMDQHCAIFEQNRAALTAACLLAFAVVALLIVLSA